MSVLKFWVPAELNSNAYAPPEEFVKTGVKPAYLPVTLGDEGFTLDWDPSVEVKVPLSEAAVRDERDEEEAAVATKTTLELKHPSPASITATLQRRHEA
jgi:hypothetical protein